MALVRSHTQRSFVCSQDAVRCFAVDAAAVGAVVVVVAEAGCAKSYLVRCKLRDLVKKTNKNKAIRTILGFHFFYIYRRCRLELHLFAHQEQGSAAYNRFRVPGKLAHARVWCSPGQ